MTRCSATRKLGHEGIVYRQVSAAPENRARRLTGAPDPAPLRVRVVPRDGPTAGTTPEAMPGSSPRREHVARDVAADIVSLCASGGADREAGSICPGHIAVLVRTNKNAARVRDALEAVDVPAVINGAGSVFATSPRASGCGCSRRSSARHIRRGRAPPRSRRSSAGRPRRWPTPTTTSGRRCTGDCITGRGCCARRASRR